MVANETYYGGRPRINRFELHAYPQSKQLVKALKSNALSAAADLSRSEATEIDSLEYVNDSYPIDNGIYALLNTSNGVFHDKAVRKAIQLALDTDAIRSSAGENVRPLDLPFIGDQVTSAALPKPVLQDTKAARKQLDDAGWKFSDDKWKKDKAELGFTITTIQNDQYVRTANEIARQLRDIGIGVKIRVVDDRLPNANFVGDVLQRRNFEMLVYELPIGADPDVYAYWHSSQVGDNGYNFTSYRDDIADAALASARDRTNSRLRDEKYALFARQWQADVPAIGLYQQVVNYLHKPSTDSIADDARFVTSSDRYANVRNWTVSSQAVYKTP